MFGRYLTNLLSLFFDLSQVVWDVINAPHAGLCIQQSVNEGYAKERLWLNNIHGEI